MWNPEAGPDPVGGSGTPPRAAGRSGAPSRPSGRGRRRAAFLGAALLLAFTATPGARADALGDPQLARWLADTAAPELAERLRRHPRLAGESVRVGTLAQREGGTPDALAAAVADQLEAELRRRRGVRLAAERGSCAPAGSLELLVDTGRTAAGQDRVDLEFLDPGTGLWLGGLGVRWEGRLAGTARAALRRAALLPADGSADRPYPPGAAGPAAERLAAELRCVLSRPHGWTGGIGAVFEGAAPEVEARLRARLADRLQPPGADPRWHLRLSREAEVVRLLVAPAGARGAPVELARVHLRATPPAPAAPVAVVPEPLVAVRPAASRAAPPPAAGLVTRLALAPAADAGGVCRGHADGCWQIDVAFAEPVWSVVAWTVTGGGRGREGLAVTGCDRGLAPQAAARRFRMRDGGAGAAVLVLASRSEAAAEEAQRILEAAPGACGSAPDPRALAHWLGGLDRRLAGLPGTVEWRLASTDRAFARAEVFR
jgi:hypothetical protein